MSLQHTWSGTRLLRFPELTQEPLDVRALPSGITNKWTWYCQQHGTLIKRVQWNTFPAGQKHHWAHPLGYSHPGLCWSAPGPHLCRWGCPTCRCLRCSGWWWVLTCARAACRRWRWADHLAGTGCHGQARQWSSGGKCAALHLSEVQKQHPRLARGNNKKESNWVPKGKFQNRGICPVKVLCNSIQQELNWK